MTTAQSTSRHRKLFAKSDKNDQARKVKEMEDREARINYTLDMVVHDLVSQGHLQPAKSYLLKTSEMKEHIGRMCDQLSRRKKDERDKSSKSRHVPKSFSAYNKQVVSSVSKVTSSRKESNANSESFDNTDNGRQKLFASKSANLSSTSNRREVKKSETWVTPRDVTNGRQHGENFPPKTEQHSSKENRIQKELSLPPERLSSRNIAPAHAYRAKIDMAGFNNDDISLDLDDRKLIITASRQRKGQQNARKVTEVIEIPEGVKLENLKISRQLDGSLLIEEFVSGLD